MAKKVVVPEGTLSDDLVAKLSSSDPMINIVNRSALEHRGTLVMDGQPAPEAHEAPSPSAEPEATSERKPRRRGPPLVEPIRLTTDTGATIAVQARLQSLQDQETRRTTLYLPATPYDRLLEIAGKKDARTQKVTVTYMIAYALWKTYPELFEEEQN